MAPDPHSPGKPYAATIRFWVRNGGRQPATVAGAVIRWQQKNGQPVEWPLNVLKGLPQTVEPLGMVGPIEGTFTVWADGLAELLQNKKAHLYAFTPSGDKIEGAELPVWPPDNAHPVPAAH